jgi:hypothetical protein
VTGPKWQQERPGAKLERMLAACGWRRVVRCGQSLEGDLWEKWQSRLLVDWVGVFLYRRQNGVWYRTHGLGHGRIRPANRYIVFMDNSILNLVSGEWNEPYKN